MKKLFEPNADYQPEDFTFADKKQVQEIIARYPKGRQRSAVMPLLDLAQRQMAKGNIGGWIPRAAMDHIAEVLELAPVKVYEVATFYSMYNLAPVGKHLVQLCTTTPCWLRGSSDIVHACEKHLGVHVGETTNDGLFTLMEVECLGACVNAPMVQINDDFYEDLTPENMTTVLKSLAKGGKIEIGSQVGRTGSAPEGEPTTLQSLKKKSSG